MLLYLLACTAPSFLNYDLTFTVTETSQETEKTVLETTTSGILENPITYTAYKRLPLEPNQSEMISREVYFTSEGDSQRVGIAFGSMTFKIDQSEYTTAGMYSDGGFQLLKCNEDDTEVNENCTPLASVNKIEDCHSERTGNDILTTCTKPFNEENDFTLSISVYFHDVCTEEDAVQDTGLVDTGIETETEVDQYSLCSMLSVY